MKRLVIHLLNHEEGASELVGPEQEQEECEAHAAYVTISQVPRHERTGDGKAEGIEDQADVRTTHNMHGLGQPGDIINLPWTSVLATAVDRVEIREA